MEPVQRMEREINISIPRIINGVFEGGLKERVSSCSLEKVYEVPEIPEFRHAHTKRRRHPLTAQYCEEAHRWLASHNVAEQMGPALWKHFVQSKIPEVAGHIFVDLDSRDFLWICKFAGWFFAIDDMMDETAWTTDSDKFCETMLNSMLVLLWNDPDNKRLLEHMRPMIDSFTTEESRALARTFHADLLHAKNKTKSLSDVKVVPLASVLRDLWTEYCEVVPEQFAHRWAESIQDFLVVCIQEASIRKQGISMNDLNDYFALRRVSGGPQPVIICMDLVIARKMDQSLHISNTIFYGPHMQSLLAAIGDIVAWHNDIYSFYKEVIVAGEKLNLIEILCAQYNCASYTEAGVIAVRMVQDRMTEMELDYEKLKAEVSTEVHPALEVYVEACRNVVTGTNVWYSITKRYNNHSAACI